MLAGIGLLTCLDVGNDFFWRRLIQGCCRITKVRGQGKVYPMLASIGLVTCLDVAKYSVRRRLIQGCCGMNKIRGQGKVNPMWAGIGLLTFCLEETHSGLQGSR